MRWKILIAAYLVLPLALMWGAGGFVIGAVIATVSLVFIDGLPEPDLDDYALARLNRSEAFLCSPLGVGLFWILWMIWLAIFMAVASSL